MTIFRIILLSLALLLSGCASNPMKVASNQSISEVNQREAQVVFMRSAFTGSAISASIYDVTDGKPEFIGIIANDTKIAYQTQPGKRRFMVVSEAADFMEADLIQGKTYYSLVTPRMGFWKARFSMWPIRNNSTAEYNMKSKEFKKWLLNTKLVENSEKSNQWFEANKASVEAKFKEYMPVWKQKSDSDLELRTLHPDDGQ